MKSLHGNIPLSGTQISSAYGYSLDIHVDAEVCPEAFLLSGTAANEYCFAAVLP